MRLQTPPVPPADLVLTGAPVLGSVPGSVPGPALGNGLGTAGDAVAVRAGRIVALGSTRQLAPLIGPGTRHERLSGGVVVPGFHDAHLHPPFAGRFLETCALHGVSGLEQVLDAVRRYAEANPQLEWIYGSGWEVTELDGQAPSAALLDRVVPDRPVFLLNASVHEAWVNSAALRRAGITAATPDPVDGYLVRDERGVPTGRLLEGAAYSFENAHVPAPDAAGWRAAILRAQRELHAVGITGWQDAWVTPATQAAYLDLVDDGTLTARVCAALWWDRHAGLEQIEELLARRAEVTARVQAAGSDRLVAPTVKIMVDGVVENGTSALLSPYLDGCRSGHGSGHGSGRTNDGLLYLDPTLLAAAVTRLDALGFSVHLHTIGDRAVRVGLDAVQAAREANGGTAGRHHLAHVQVVHPDDVPRFAALGVTANCQAYWAQSEPAMDDLTIPVLGPERSRWQYPFAALAAAGARLAMGSDWPVSTPDPLAQLDVAVHRSERGRTPAFLPEQALTLDQALTAFTAGSAHVNHDDEAGTIAVGSRADLVVLDRDPRTDPRHLADTSVTLTVAAGHVVHPPPTPR